MLTPLLRSHLQCSHSESEVFEGMVVTKQQAVLSDIGMNESRVITKFY